MTKIATPNATAAALLGFLHERPMTGWDLRGHAEKTIGDFWTVTRSQIYRELRAMSEGGLIKAEETGPRDRQPYSITDAGRAAFREWVLAPPGAEQIRYPLLLAIAFSGHLSRDTLNGFVEDHKKTHEERLQRHESEKEMYWNEMPAESRATLQFGLRYERAVLQWIDDLTELLD